MGLDAMLVLLIFVVTSLQTRSASAGALDVDMQWLVLFSLGNLE